MFKTAKTAAIIPIQQRASNARLLESSQSKLGANQKRPAWKDPRTAAK